MQEGGLNECVEFRGRKPRPRVDDRRPAKAVDECADLTRQHRYLIAQMALRVAVEILDAMGPRR